MNEGESLLQVVSDMLVMLDQLIHFDSHVLNPFIQFYLQTQESLINLPSLYPAY